jgi:hypothetical protein
MILILSHGSWVWILGLWLLIPYSGTFSPGSWILVTCPWILFHSSSFEEKMQLKRKKENIARARRHAIDAEVVANAIIVPDNIAMAQAQGDHIDVESDIDWNGDHYKCQHTTIDLGTLACREFDFRFMDLGSRSGTSFHSPLDPIQPHHHQHGPWILVRDMCSLFVDLGSRFVDRGSLSVGHDCWFVSIGYMVVDINSWLVDLGSQFVVGVGVGPGVCGSVWVWVRV